MSRPDLPPLLPLPPPQDPEEEYVPPDHPPPAHPSSSLSLHKQHSWSPDIYREEAWIRRKGNYRKNRRRSKSVTDEDLDELKACIELGFGFDSPEVDPRLSDTLPALEFYHAVVNNKQYNDIFPRSSTASPAASDCDSSTSPIGSPNTIALPEDNSRVVKTRLRQWAQVVACSVRQSSG